MKRQLRSVGTEEVLGAVTDNPPYFEGAAADVLSGPRRELGDETAAAQVLRDGWSNGYLYFAEPTA